MGTHPAAPSSLAPDVSLHDWVARNPAALSRAVAARWGGDLPFLFKVLSVAKALSIQAHPDRDLAAALHALRPATYRDANHKPEMAVAVTDFHALCGFVATKDGATLMHYAVQTACSQTIKTLLLYNVDINRPDDYGWTPLHLAVQTQRTDIVKLLLIKGADRTLKTQDNMEALRAESVGEGDTQVSSVQVVSQVLSKNNASST